CVGARVTFGAKARAGREGELHLPGRQGERAQVAGRPAGGEQPLRIGAAVRTTGGGQFDVDASVTGAGGAVAAAGGVGLRRVQDFFELTHGWFFIAVGRREGESTSRANLRKDAQAFTVEGYASS